MSGGDRLELKQPRCFLSLRQFETATLATSVKQILGIGENGGR